MLCEHFLLGGVMLLSFLDQIWISQKMEQKDGRRQEKATDSQDTGSQHKGCRALPVSLGC